ncbi:MAG: PEFG-CTERM sorting domain-containing protein [Nitrosarchaeum sp.]|nr:PEFG-CTERM sorting domain-containing protein [Nitrosarchaeum sp.]
MRNTSQLTPFCVIVIFSLFVLVFFSYSQEGFAAARYPCCIEWSLDKTEYMAGDTVIIDVKASGDLEDSEESVTVTISEVTYGPDYSNIVFEESRKLQEENLVFKYKIPEKDSDRYRYLVSVDTPAQDEPKMFFTKRDASKIAVSDLNVFNPVVMQGEPVKFQAKVVDGVGNPSHYISMSAFADIPHENCRSGWAGTHVHVSPLYSIQPDYWSAGILTGELVFKDTAKPGKYTISLHASGTEDGYELAERSFTIEILQNNKTREPLYTVFAPRETDFGSGFPTEQPIEVTGKTAYNGCGTTLPNVPITAEIKRYDLQHRRWMETLVTQESMSDENGEYYFHFDPLGLRPGYYEIQLTPEYEGIEQTVGTVFPNNIKNFTIIEEGKKFQIPVDGYYFIPEKIVFDKERKTLTIDLDTAEPFRQVGFSIPSELLDGDFTVFVNGIERDGNIRKTDGYTHFSPWPGEDDHTTIQVVGTTAIPEFQTVATMILAASILPIMLLRKKFSKNTKTGKYLQNGFMILVW